MKVCNGNHCTETSPLIRIIPLDDSVNVHLCSSCYCEELSYNEQLELDGKERVLPDLPFCVYPVFLYAPIYRELETV